MLRLGKVNIADLTEARLIFEPEAARLAARRATKKDMEKLEQDVERAKNPIRPPLSIRRSNLEFHRQMARISRNPVVIFIINSVIDIMIENVSRTTLDMASIKKVIEYHEEIIQSIRNHDYDRSFTIMRKHIVDIQKALEKSEGRLSGIEG